MSETEDAFLAARRAVDRGALLRYKRDRGVTKESSHEQHRAAEDEFRGLALLGSPDLAALAREAISSARGRTLSGAEPFQATIWTGGAEHVRDGRPHLGSIRDFAERILPSRARAVAPKRAGWVLEPTTNPRGRRTNEETLAVHALFLDCDGTGEWAELLDALGALGLCYVAYQSGGWAPETPKWRVVLPLDRPHATATEAGRAAWRCAYAHARVAFGALGRLRSVGFDPATDTPCNPWFLTEKRAPADPERRVAWRPGRALDLTALALALPAVPAEPEREYEEHARAAAIELDEARFEGIVDALAAATAHVPAGRRDIYLAVPAVLLDRGLSPDDARAVMEEVSLRYPRHHADKHADNLHCAETTIDKWVAEGPSARVTRIGTLQSLAPEVAAALDEVLPDRVTEALLESFNAAPAAPQPWQAPHDPTSDGADEEYREKMAAPPPRRARRKLSPIGRRLAPAASRLKHHKSADRQVQGLLLDRLARGQSLLPDGATLDRPDDVVYRALEAAGYQLSDASWQAVLDEAAPSMLATGFELSSERVALAKAHFERGQVARMRSKRKRAVKREREQRSRAADARRVIL